MLKIEDFFEYNLYKNGLLTSDKETSLEQISDNNMGIHSARITTPYVTFCSRKSSFVPIDLYNLLYVDRKLIKLRCMRTTLHIVPVECAHIYHMATKKIRMQKVFLDFKKYNVNPDIITDIKKALFNSKEELFNPNDIEKIILSYLNFDNEYSKLASKAILKFMWEDGFLCYVNISKKWECENRMYAITEKFYHGLNLNVGTVEEAQRKLISQYILKFGPVTIEDISWWSGISKREIFLAIQGNESIQQLDIENKIFYIDKNDYEKYKEYNKIKNDYVLLLAYEDSCLKGFYETRNRYINSNVIHKAFNVIGEVMPCIIYNGKVVGKWNWDKKNKCINLEYFYKNLNIKHKVNSIRKDYEFRLNGVLQSTLFDE